MAVPVVAVCGYSGSGKTTLLERLIPDLRRRGLLVGVVKHDAHGATTDQPGKDSDRLFRAGALVCLEAPNETFLRLPPTPERRLRWALEALAREVDLLLVEGHKDTPLPKVWLEHPTNREVPGSLTHLLAVLPWGEGRHDAARRIVLEQLSCQVAPLWAGILVGGRSLRMGQPKQTLALHGCSLLAHQQATLAKVAEEVVVVGEGPLPPDVAPMPILPDPPGPGGPLAGMLAALRWQPAAAWFFVPVDAVALSTEFVDWLARQRHPGVWGIQVETCQGQVEPLFTVLAPQMKTWVERTRARGCGPWDLAGCPKLQRVRVPVELEPALTCVNTPEEWQQFLARVASAPR